MIRLCQIKLVGGCYFILSSLTYLLDSSVCLGMLCLSGFLSSGYYSGATWRLTSQLQYCTNLWKVGHFLSRISWLWSLQIQLGFHGQKRRWRWRYPSTPPMSATITEKTKTELKFNFKKKKCYYLRLHSIGLLLSHFLDLSMYKKTIFCK